MKLWMNLAGLPLLAAALAGCSTELAQTPLGVEEESWQRTIKSSYSSWNPPRVAPPAIKDNMSDKYVPEEPAATAGQDKDSAVIPAADDIESAGAGTAIPAGDTIPADVAANAADTAAPVAADAAAPAAPAEECTEYTVVKGDSLSVIARKVYKDGRLYYPILKANEDVLKGNPNRIYPGMKLRIPKR